MDSTRMDLDTPSKVLDTYTSNQNYPYFSSFNSANSYGYQSNQLNGQLKHFNNPFNSYYGPNQGYNLASNGQSSFTNLPFNGYNNPSIAIKGNFPVQIVASAKPSMATPKPNDKTEETQEELRINRQPRA